MKLDDYSFELHQERVDKCHTQCYCYPPFHLSTHSDTTEKYITFKYDDCLPRAPRLSNCLLLIHSFLIKFKRIISKYILCKYSLNFCIQTTKDHLLQCLTWSNYKHHNTLKVLVVIAPRYYVYIFSLPRLNIR